MKKTRWKNIIRNVRESLNRFLSILFIVALGAGFMSGLAAASPDMYDAADQYIREYRLFDIDIKSAIGLSRDDINKIAQQDSVSYAEEAVVFDMVLDLKGGSDFTSRVFGMLDTDGSTRLNKIDLIEGRLPESPDECVVESIFGRYSGEDVHIGDTLTLSEGNTNYDQLADYMLNTEVTIVGICQSPMCMSVEGDPTNIGSGTINLNVYVKKEFFTCDFYTDIFLSVEGADKYNTFDEQYHSFIADVIEELKPLGGSLSSDRLSTLTEELDLQTEQLRSLTEQVSQIIDTKEALQADLQIRREQNEAIAEILPGISSLLTESSLQDPLVSSYTSPSGLYDFLQSKLSEAEDTLALLEDSVWLYRTRDDLTGFDSYSNNVGKVSALAKIFPVFFFIVALLVALTTMSRLIEEKRLQIGTLKAIGYSNRQILFEYLLFSLSASVLGCILGFSIGFRVFPMAVDSAYSMMYFLPAISTPIRWDIVAWVAPVTIISILLAAVWSCWNEFRSMPSLLMMPKSPPAGKRIWLEHIGFIWHNMSFTYKVTFRNLFRYKKRFIMTIIGVAGCSALLLTGFGIKDSVNDIVDKQFGELYTYDLIFALDQERSLSSDTLLTTLLSDENMISDYALASQESGRIYFGNKKKDLTLYVPENMDQFPEFTVLRSRSGHERYQLTSDGVVLTEKLCEEMKISAGDTVILEDSEGHQKVAYVTAVAENYVYSFAYMTAEYYDSLFHHAPSYTSILCKQAVSSEMTDKEITSAFLADQHILYGRSVSSLKESFSDSIRSINGVIYILIIAAGLLCIVVLYNLTNVNICERRKELATLRVLGFYKKETRNYIFRETNILSFIGALVGLLIGIWLHALVVRTVEVNNIMFGRDIKPLSFVIALAISVIFTLIVDFIMRRSINNTDMVEAMKAND